MSRASLDTVALGVGQHDKALRTLAEERGDRRTHVVTDAIG